jgi:hypothetical protein
MRHPHKWDAMPNLVIIVLIITNACSVQSESSTTQDKIAILNVLDLGIVQKYSKQEISFDITSTAENLQLPFDPSPPSGVDGLAGVSVDGVFTSPTGKIWHQPAFHYQIFEDQVKDGTGWFYPTGQMVWKIRFSPNEEGSWKYHIEAQDRTGKVQSETFSFEVTTSSQHGFIRASKTDPRYFEYTDGTYFPALGINSGLEWSNPASNQGYLEATGQNGIQVIRTWLTTWSIFGSSWNPWYGSRNDYDGYIPRPGIVTNGVFVEPMSQMRLVYAEDNSNWFDTCRVIGAFDTAPAVKRNTKYRIRIRYKAQGISGPRDPAYSGYGFVAKVQNPNNGQGHSECFNGGEPQNGVRVTGYGQDTPDWAYLEGEWDSGDHDFLPFFYLSLENVNDITPTVNGRPWNRHAEVDIDTVFIGEDLGNGNHGPNIMTKPSMEHLTYYMERNAHAFDKTLELAEENGVYLKVVIMEKNEVIENEIGYDGKSAEFDNNNFYGDYRNMTAVRWYQQAWWRYLQARWGYSPNIFAFEAVNEAEPGNTNHYAQVDEMGKYFHCGVFSVSILPSDGEKCTLDHPNAHMVSTSFWSGFEWNLFVNDKYSNIDFADIHQYIPRDTDPLQFNDTALATYDLGLQYGAFESGSAKPIIRGETGLIDHEADTGSSINLSSDTQGIWLHNLIWGGINPTGLIEHYWYASKHIYNATDLRYQFKNYYEFIKDIPLNNGNYVDAAVTVSNPDIRVWGQKDLTNHQAHLWIANTDHYWTNTETLIPISGTISISGFPPNTLLNVEWWNTYNGEVTDTQTISTNTDGKLLLTISDLISDLAVRIKNQ